MKLRAVLANAAVIGVALLVGLALCELGARVFLRASDFLGVEMVRDDILGGVPVRSASGGRFDEWGFRNPAVPESVDIVAIGDSHTFGNTATMDDSWPYVLSRQSGQSVYNMGMGGYGPNQYAHLLSSRALGLKPKTIIVGLYMGDDFENAYLITYGLEHWRRLRGPAPRSADFDIWTSPPALSWHKRLRVWLSRNSLLYQLVFHGPLLGSVKGEVQIRNAAALHDGAVTLDLTDKNILEAFLPRNLLKNLDQNSEPVREGMRITYQLLGEMNQIAREAGVRFLVAVIPTKEMVFAEYLEHDEFNPEGAVIDRLLANERIARERTFGFLQSAGIDHVDTLPALRNNAGQRLYARTSTDMHPGPNGYRVIAGAIGNALTRLHTTANGTRPQGPN